MTSLWRLAPSLLLALAAQPASSAVISTTQIAYFTVGGSTSTEIFRSILSYGPRVGGSQSIASIGTRAVQDGGLKQSGGACHVTGYSIHLTFVIRRPRIGNISALSPADRAAWQQMNGFIIAHEGQHKANWLSCVGKLDSQMSRLSAPSCGDLAAKANGLWQQMLARCDALQHSFDAAQSRALEQQPFMVHARGRDF